MSKNIIEIALNAGFINTSNGLESPFIEGEDLTDNLKLFASLLLAQPDTEQEPVAWMQDSIELYVLEEKSAIRGYVIPLYTAPPKREPLSEDAIHAYLSLIEPPFLWDEGFCSGIEWAEKQHGIGGGE